jgi:hypothetical protein
MNRLRDVSRDVLSTLSALCDDAASQEDVNRLERSVNQDRNTIALVLDYLQLHSDLYFELTSRRASSTLLHGIGAIPAAENVGYNTLTPNVAGTTSSPLGAQSAPRLPDPVQSSGAEEESSKLCFPALASLDTTAYGTVGWFSSGWPVAYLIATVVTGIGLWIGSLAPAFYPQQIAKRSSSTREIKSASEPYMEFVGQITAMADCQWARGAVPLLVNDAVPVGREIKLESGLMQITYDSGAKVILQGPVTYEVDSARGGYLALGKITARFEKKGERGARRREGAAVERSAFSVHGSPKPRALSPATPLPSALFAVRTPTATVTDIGTEFGVEVDQGGSTTSHVYRGSIEVRYLSARGEPEGESRVLHENQSVRVEKDGGQPRIVVVRNAKPADFIREIPRRTIKVLDLVDVVAGGNGFFGRRNAGIDPTTGLASDTGSKVPHDVVTGDRKYHRVEGLPFVDGVFIPDGRAGPVQIDSAGHTFADWPDTANRTGCWIWAAGADRANKPPTVGIGNGGGIDRTKLSGIDYASPGHGLLVITSNKGITFDLDAVRRANPGYKLLGFRAVAGDTEPESENGDRAYFADVWVLVDGQVRFRRRQITGRDGAYSVAFSINDHERFLTLAATDGGDNVGWDWIIFGDPRLELLSPQP